MYKPSDAYYKEFTTANPTTGAAANADSLPTATANHNGTDDGSFTLTVTNLDTGRYKITGTVPSGYVKGDVVNVSVAATCSSVAGKAVVDTFSIDSKRVGDLNDSSYNGGAVASVTGSVGSVMANVTVGAYATGQDPATLVLDVAASGHNSTNTIGNKINSAGSAGDPWSTTIPGSYVAGTAGAILGGNLDAKVSTRSTFAGGAVASVTSPVTVGTNNDKTGYTLTASQTFSTTGSVGSVTGSVAAVSANVTVGGYASGQDPATLVLDSPAVSHRAPNTVGATFSMSVTGTTGSGSDPWATPLPGNYPPGTAGAILGGNLDEQISAVKNKTDGLPTSFPANFQALAVDATTGGVTVLLNQDKNGYILGSAGLDGIQVETGINARQALTPILAASAGLVSGAGTGAVVITGGNTSVTRITATTDKLGNRSAVTLALPPATAGGVIMTASSYFPTAYFPMSYFPIGKVTQPAG
jgi:hypothetical protein